MSSTSDALVDDDGTFTLSWNVSPGPNQGGYTHLLQRFNGGTWISIYGAGLGPQSHTVTVTQPGVYDHKVNYGYMPQNPCGGRYCSNPGLTTGSITLPTVQYIPVPGTGGTGGGAGASGDGGTGGSSAGSGGSAGQSGSGGTAGTGGPPPGVCGNGVPDPGEECDDGNFIGGDGCEPDCTSTPAGQGGSGGTAGTGGTACTSDAECPAGQTCAGGTCV